MFSKLLPSNQYGFTLVGAVGYIFRLLLSCIAQRAVKFLGFHLIDVENYFLFYQTHRYWQRYYTRVPFLMTAILVYLSLSRQCAGWVRCSFRFFFSSSKSLFTQYGSLVSFLQWLERLLCPCLISKDPWLRPYVNSPSTFLPEPFLKLKSRAHCQYWKTRIHHHLSQLMKCSAIRMLWVVLIARSSPLRVRYSPKMKIEI